MPTLVSYDIPDKTSGDKNQRVRSYIAKNKGREASESTYIIPKTGAKTVLKDLLKILDTDVDFLVVLDFELKKAYPSKATRKQLVKTMIDPLPT